MPGGAGPSGNPGERENPAKTRHQKHLARAVRGYCRDRALWGKYQAAYQEVIRHTSTEVAPWHVVPADHKWFARVVIGSTIVATLDKLDLHFPKVDKAERSEFKQVRQALLAEGKGGVKKVTKEKVAKKKVTEK